MSTPPDRGPKGIMINRVGVRVHLAQFLWLVAATILVGGVVGTERAVVPLLGTRVYHAGTALAFTFIVAFGISKAIFNLVAGRWSDRGGRRIVLLTGWMVGLPMVALLLGIHAWWAVITANVLLGINQALTWTMTVTSQMDLAGPHQRGLAMGINEATGYIGVALSTAAAASIAARWGLSTAPFVFMAVVVICGLGMTVGMIRETRHHAVQEQKGRGPATAPVASTWETFWDTTVRHPALSTAVLGGIVNKLADTVAWGGLPLFFAAQGLTISTIGLLSGVYAMTWGVAQFGTGALSDHWGRKPPIVLGLGLLGSGLWAMPLGHSVFVWGLAAGVMGLGMALLYPNLNAAVGDVAPPAQRGTILGIYRLWRDGGYAIGGLLAGILFTTLGSVPTIQLLGVVVVLTAALTAWRLPETHAPLGRHPGA